MLAVIVFAATWMINKKMGLEGWKAFVPLYNLYTRCKVLFGSGWLFLLAFIPVVNLAFAIVYVVKLVEGFKLKGWFLFGTIFAFPVFFLIIAFNDSQFRNITVSNDDMVTKAVFRIKDFINGDTHNTEKNYSENGNSRDNNSINTFDDLPNL